MQTNTKKDVTGAPSPVAFDAERSGAQETRAILPSASQSFPCLFSYSFRVERGGARDGIFLVLDAGRGLGPNRGIVRTKAARNSASQRGGIALVIDASWHSANNSARGHPHRQRRLRRRVIIRPTSLVRRGPTRTCSDRHNPTTRS